MRIVGLGAICDLNPNRINDRRENSFRVSEFVLLDNGERVILHDELPYEVVLTERVLRRLSTNTSSSTDDAGTARTRASPTSGRWRVPAGGRRSR